MAGTIVNNPVVQFFDNNGNPLVGGKITTYLSNTVTPASTWQNEALSTLNTNPIILNSRGEATIWLTPDVQYTFKLTDANDNLIQTVNDIYGGFQSVNGIDASVVSYTPAGTRAVATKVKDQLRFIQQNWVNVKDAPYYAVGDGVADDTTAIQAALDSGADVIIFTSGDYLITTQLKLSTSGQKLLGQGGRLVKGTGTIEPLYLMVGVDIPDISFENLNFSVKAGTAHLSRGGFVALTRCHFATVNGCVFNAAIPGTVTQRESIESCFNPLSCNYLKITNNQFIYSWGNGCSANDSVGDGVNGNNITITGNLFFNVLDTGVGIFTNARNVTVSGNVFYRKDFSTAANGVHIDVAGGQNVTIDGNVLTGNTLGVRVLTNIGYTNQRIIVSNNVFQEQDRGSSEPPQCVKISHDGAGGGENDFNCMVLGNTFSVQDNGWGISISSTGTTDVLTAKIDNNMFNLRGVSAIGVNFIGTNAGNLKLSPGKNTFIGQGQGALAVQGTLPKTVAINGGQENRAYSKNDFTAAFGSGVNLVGSFYLGRGLYAVTANLGAYSGVDTTVRVRDLAGAAKANTFLLTTASANTSFNSLWNFNNIEEPCQLTFDTGGTMSTDVRYLNVVRLI